MCQGVFAALPVLFDNGQGQKLIPDLRLVGTQQAHLLQDAIGLGLAAETQVELRKVESSIDGIGMCRAKAL